MFECHRTARWVLDSMIRRHSKFELLRNVRADRRLENVFDSS
ncbi:hypothetical protein RB5476 [Rhodopirellula baltica SH 1]|uniref:Uncharacterized protein n=1 Tax=Rhodopirellula baltica (strain DSM 10527 / NCIMB 13988 / SH1) TaxID=243090 RepID=Q7URS5_RHOBA|nr:hypothetical protein RB5476 [Rhodopirellula baltica SH 1]